MALEELQRALEQLLRALGGSRGAVDYLQMPRLQTRVVEYHNIRYSSTNTEYQRIQNTNEYRIPTNTEYQRIVNEYRIPIIRWYSVFVGIRSTIRWYSVFVVIRYSLNYSFNYSLGIRWYSVDE